MGRLYRSRKSRVIAGVCGGIAEYFNVDPVLVRIIAILFLFTGGASLIAYIVGMIIIPRAPEQEHPVGEPAPPTASPERERDLGRTGSLIVGIILVLIGVNLLFRNIPFFGQYYWWFWGIGWHFFWPSMLIAVGVLVIFLGSRKS